VTAFSDATLALEAFRARPDEFDIVLTDLAMPKLPGFELARQVLAVRPDVPVLLLSGNIGHDDEAHARAIGIRQMVLKPVAMSALVRIMERQFNAAAPVPASPAAPVAPGDGAGGDEAGTAAR
jgi:DNA-binding NarL/FixJ family response regulator